ncbi:MAG: LPXTG cell wall anchor domain-containing protein [Oscillospiraceae bacterium]|nr:LPXTG cell wall anchor domain-containing protein [Oscillospiraceae bacterium]
MAHKLMKSAIGAFLTAMVLFAPSTFAETSTSPSGEVMGVSGEESVGSLRVHVRTGDSETAVELRFALKNSEDEFAQLEPISEEDPVFQVTDWKPPETDPESDNSVVLSVVSDTFEIVGLPHGDYKLISLDKDFTVENNGEQQDYILVVAGEYDFAISPAENPAESDSDEYSEDAEQPAEIADLELDYASKSLVLPDTGGIGTTVFYIVGGTMAAVSAAMLIARFKNRKK